MNRLQTILLAAAVGSISIATVAIANPEGGRVVSGQGTISAPNANEVLVTQSSNTLILNWDTFNIDAGEVTRFVQSDASSLAVNRIGGNDPSAIYGSLIANGRIILINPNGLLFGDTAQVNVNSLVATTHDASDVDILAGRYNFDISGNPTATVENRGSITAAQGGSVALVAPGVSNSGTITATLGSISLGAANKFKLDFTGDNLISFPVDSEIVAEAIGADGQPVRALISNSGTLKGSKVVLSARAAANIVANAINMDGTIIATAAVQDGDDIVLGDTESANATSDHVSIDGGSNGVVSIAGKIEATGQRGGKVTVTGDAIALRSGSAIDVSGTEGGGTILVGGGYQGSGSLPHARFVHVESGANLAADATGRGNGGTVVLWSDVQTAFAGSISARGGAEGGDGGLAEVSSRGHLGFFGTADLRAPLGELGTLLLDPRNITIDDVGGSITIPSVPGAPIVFESTGDDSILPLSVLLNALQTANVTVATGGDGTQAGDITVATNIAWAGSNSLTLSAHRDVIVEAGATISNTGSGNLSMRSDSQGAGTGTVVLSGSNAINFQGSTGTVSIFYNPGTNPAGSVVNATSYTSGTNFASNVQVNPGQLTAYMLVNTVFDLQNVRNNPSGNFALGADIDATATINWNSGAGFKSLPFSGVFDGLGHRINGLYFKGSDTVFNAVGLFSTIEASGVIRDVHLTNLYAEWAPGALCPNCLAGVSLGGLASHNNGTILDSSVAGSLFGSGSCISGSGCASAAVGGLVGFNTGLILRSHSSGTVSGGTSALVGGLVGLNLGYPNTPFNYGTILESFSTATVRGNGEFVEAGGLVGTNDGPNASIRASYATGAVTSNVIGVGSSFAISRTGGLVGANRRSTIDQVYATGQVTSTVTGTAGFVANFVGGLVGVNSPLGPISSSYWDTVSTGRAGSAGGTGFTTTQLKAALPPGFDPSVWAIDPTINNGYPYLRWQISQPTLNRILLNFGASAHNDQTSDLLTQIDGRPNTGWPRFRQDTHPLYRVPGSMQLVGNASDGTRAWPLSQHDLDVYRDDRLATARDYDPEFGEAGVEVHNIACLATVYVMLERASGRTAYVDDFIGSPTLDPNGRAIYPNPVSPEYVGQDEPFNLSLLSERIQAGRPTILHGVGGPLGNHFMLVVGVVQSESGVVTHLVVADPYRSTRSLENAPFVLLPIDPTTNLPTDPAYRSITFDQMRSVDASFPVCGSEC